MGYDKSFNPYYRLKTLKKQKWHLRNRSDLYKALVRDEIQQEDRLRLAEINKEIKYIEQELRVKLINTDGDKEKKQRIINEITRLMFQRKKKQVYKEVLKERQLQEQYR